MVLKLPLVVITLLRISPSEAGKSKKSCQNKKFSTPVARHVISIGGDPLKRKRKREKKRSYKSIWNNYLARVQVTPDLVKFRPDNDIPRSWVFHKT